MGIPGIPVLSFGAHRSRCRRVLRWSFRSEVLGSTGCLAVWRFAELKTVPFSLSNIELLTRVQEDCLRRGYNEETRWWRPPHTPGVGPAWAGGEDTYLGRISYV